MKYQQKRFTVPVQPDESHPKAADLDDIFGNKDEFVSIRDQLPDGVEISRRDDGTIIAHKSVFSVHFSKDTPIDQIPEKIEGSFLNGDQ